MDPTRQGFPFEPPQLGQRDTADEVLAHWDDLAPADLRLVDRHPVHGPRLRMLQDAETWLAGCAPSNPSAGDACPSADELYDFGRGPGYRTLDAERRAVIDHHLEQCSECELLVESLTSAPPVPLELIDLPPEIAGEPAAHLEPVLTPVRDRRSWVPLAAAAALFLAVTAWMGFESRGSSGAFPDAPLLRGAEAGSLYFPRGRVLFPGELGVAEDGIAAWSATSSLAFEVAPDRDAGEYRVELSRHSGGAFDGGEPIGNATSTDPHVLLELAEPLKAGHYTWSAWAVVRGLDRSLGERDFQVVDDPDLVQKLSGTSGTESVRILHEAGFTTDARAQARTLPSSAERDAYLATPPGR